MARARKAPRSPTGRGAIYALDEHGKRPDDDAEDDEGDSSQTTGPAGEETPEEREKRIADLKKQIAEGTYNPDPHEIARKLLERGF